MAYYPGAGSEEFEERLCSYLSESFEVFLERVDSVEPGDREVPINLFFREEKRVCGTPPARS
ncbi:hypothetical protein [Nitrosococcus wardiae]|uniref:Uncharacterized protein n=1 Tax=Nitrosococcus wardiae TaxID=1814290 RepID=A0A4V1AW35_9GAMM|nr:hypothetical protein [Nitrosococcus wardiae]QBQ55255.1 hypothetical protein E3U44_12590 [Nitrosococcus wardiae]